MKKIGVGRGFKCLREFCYHYDYDYYYIGILGN